MFAPCPPPREPSRPVIDTPPDACDTHCHVFGPASRFPYAADRSYQITGGQPTATASGTDLVTMARGAGLTQSAWAADEEMFDEMFARALTEDGPWLIAVRIDDKPGVGATERDPVLITDRFMRGLGTKG